MVFQVILHYNCMLCILAVFGAFPSAEFACFGSLKVTVIVRVES